MSWDIFGTERDSLRTENSELSRKNRDLKCKLDKTENELEKTKKEFEKIEKALHDLYPYKHKYDLACRENEVLQHKLNKSQEEINALNLKLKTPSNNSEIEALTDDIKKLQYNNYLISEEAKRLKHTNSKLETELTQTKEDLDYFLNNYDSIDEMIKKQEDLENKLKKETESVNRIKAQIDSVSSLPYAQLPDDFKDSILTGRLANAFEATSLSIHGKLQISAAIRSDDHFYNTSLTGCSCPDFQNRHIPCKHMLFLSYTSGLMLLNNEAFSDFTKTNISRLNAKILSEKEEAASAKHQNKLLQQNKREQIKLIDRLISELDQSYPWLAAMYKRFQIEQDNHDAYLLSSRSSSAKDIVKKLKKSNKNLKYEKALLENQLLVYETLFPWLEEFKKVDIDKAVEYVKQTQDDEEYDKVSDFLSPAEYKALSVTKKNQLALDRYKKHRKSDWEIGVDYERYVGYLYETKGYKVKYSGAVDRLKDMGRDLICTRGDKILVIQCKRWSIHKTIHEKHIFQLFGSTIQLKYLNPDKNYTPVFVTTTQLSEVAAYCAQQLGIEIIEKEKYTDYPCIKCNISKDGSKIYHLPFDQQYDKISIDQSAGECYASTVEEAEQRGFRRAYRHKLS